MNQKAIYKAIISIAIAVAFIMPGAVALANVEQTMNKNVSSEIGNITDLPTLDDDSDIEISEPLTTIDWWPMFHHDAENTGNSSSTAPDTNNVLWEYGTGGTVASSPAVVDGKVFFGSIDGNLYCLDALTGAWIWQYPTGDTVWSSPAVVDGKVFIGSGEMASGASNVYCVDALTGAWIWQYTTGGGVDSSPVVADGKVFFGSHDGNVYCVDALTGAWIWQYTTGGGVFSSPAVAEGKVYFGSKDFNLYCVDALTGAWIWQYTTGSIGVMSSPAVADGKVYFGASNLPFGTVYCLDALTGAWIWQYMTMGNMVQSSPAVADGKVFVGAFNGNVYCLDALTGAWIWQYTTGGTVLSSPAVADGKVYFGSDDNNIYCLDTDGMWIWQHLTVGTVRSSPAIAIGKVFIGSSDNFIYCFGTEHDTTPPVTTHEFEGDMGDNGWFISDVTVILTAEDDSSGVNYTMYKLDDNEWEIYEDPFVVTEDGEHTIEYYSVDKVGNEEDPCDPVLFKIDQTAPTIDLTVEKTGLIKWLLTATVSDETSDITKVEFYLDGELLGTVTEPPYEWICTEKGTAQAIVYDNAGNEAISDPVPVSYIQNQIQSSSNLVPVQRKISLISLGGLAGIQNTQRRVYTLLSLFFIF